VLQDIEIEDRLLEIFGLL